MEHFLLNTPTVSLAIYLFFFFLKAFDLGLRIF